MHHIFYNITADSVQVLNSDDNRNFYEFQRVQKSLNTANTWLLQMMRLFPLHDPFHRKIEDEYFLRYDMMEQFVKPILTSMKQKNNNSLPSGGLGWAKVTLAYYVPVNPDWKQPDPWRDSIMATHFFEYFNPADSFYLHTNILPEKMDIYLAMRTDLRDAYGQPIVSDSITASAAQDFLEKVKSNQDNFEFCLNYLLKKFNMHHQNDALLRLYDNNVKTEAGECEPSTTTYNWIREKADILRNIKIGQVAPDFEITGVGAIHESPQRLLSVKSNYTLVLFWASWCPHCQEELPQIKKLTDSLNEKNAGAIHESPLLTTVAVSLDTSRTEWQNFIQKGNYTSWLNTSELKRWSGSVPKEYNVYATPTMFVLDKDKKIIAKPMDVWELKDFFANLNSKKEKTLP